MIVVYCHGGLRHLGPYRIEASSTMKACRLIAVQVPAFDRAMRSGAFRVRLGPQGKGGQTLRAGQEKMRLGRHNEIHITPAGRAAIGKNRALGKVILGVALIGVGLTGGALAAPAAGLAGLSAGLGTTAALGISWGSIALTGASMLVSGAAQMIAGNPQVSRYENREAPEDRPNFLFSRAANTINEGPALAWVWGKDVFVGTSVVSAGITDEQIGPGLAPAKLDGLVADFNSSARASIIAAKGKKSKFKPPEESPDSLQSKSIARILEAVGEGELELVDGRRSIYLDRTPVDNDDDTTNFPGYVATWRSGTADQSAIPGLSELEAFEDVGAIVTVATPIIRQISDPNISAVRVHIRFHGGLQGIDTSGDIRPTTVEYGIDYRENGGDWVEAHAVKLVGKASAGYQVAYRVDLPAGGEPWDIRVRRVTPDSIVLTRIDEFSFAGMTTLIDARLKYPYSAMILHEIDSKAFGFDIPQRMLRVRRVDGLIPSNYDPDTREYNSFWDGTFKAGCSDNPAWGLRDLLTSNRFGCGEDIDDDAVDDGLLYVIAQYCDGLVPDGRGGMEPRYTFNGALSTREDAYQVLNAIAAAFRGMIFWGPGAVVAAQDRPKDPVKHIIAANTLGAEIAYEGIGLQSRHTVVKVTWNDPELLGDAAIAYEADYDELAAIGSRELDLYAWGCNSEGLAHRIGRWVLETEKSASEVAKWRAALDNADLMPGDIVTVADETISGSVSFAGRIVSVDTLNDTVTLDRMITIDSEQTYIISIVGVDGLPFERTIIDTSGTYTTVHLDSALPSPPPINGATWVIESTDLAPRYFQVFKNAQTAEMEFSLGATLHDPTMFDRIELEINLPPRPTSLLPYSKPSTPTNLAVSEYLYQAGPSIKSAALFGWESSDDASVRGFEAEYIPPSGTDYVPLGSGLEVTRTILDIQPGVYSFRVRAYSHLGVRSDWAEVSGSLLQQQSPLADVTQFRGSLVGGQLNLSWLPITDLRNPPYRIRYSPSLSGVVWSQMTDLLVSVFGSQASTPAMPGTYAIKAKTAYAESANATFLIIPAVPSNFNIIDTLEAHPDWLGDISQFIVSSGNLVLEEDVTGPGIYTIAEPYDLGAAFSARILSNVLVSAINTDDVLANWITLASISTLSGVSPDDWMTDVYLRTTNDNPDASPVWTDFAPLQAGIYTARAFEFQLRAEVERPEIRLVISEWNITVDMEDRIISLDDLVSSASVPTHVTFDPPFKEAPKVLVTAQDMATGDFFILGNKATDGFDIRFFNSASAGISRTFDAAGIGFGIGSGEFPDGALINVVNSLGLTSGLRLVLDAGDVFSYRTGQSWLDRSGNGYDFFRGTTSGADATDPTFNGAPGLISDQEYFSMDGGDRFTYDSANETWMNNLHKDGAKYTIVMWIWLDPTAGTVDLLATHTTTNGTGFAFRKSSSHQLQIVVGNGSALVASIADADVIVPMGSWAFVAVSIDEAVPSHWLFCNGQLAADAAAYSSPSASAAEGTFTIGSETDGGLPWPAGSRIAMLGIWEGVSLTSAQIEDIFESTRGRFSVEPIPSSTLWSIIAAAGLKTGAIVCLDAGDPRCYSGAGQKWTDSIGSGQDFFLGADGSATATDPTFNGDAGDASADEFFSCDGGDYFTYDTTNDTWIENLHKDNAIFTLMAIIRVPDATPANNRGIFGTAGALGAGIGVQWSVHTSGVLDFRVNHGAGSALTAFSAAQVVANEWTMVAISVNESVGAGGVIHFINGISDTDTSTYTTPSASAASQTAQIGATGNGQMPLEAGTEIACFAAWTVALNATQLNTIFNAIRGRFGI